MQLNCKVLKKEATLHLYINPPPPPSLPFFQGYPVFLEKISAQFPFIVYY